MAALRLAIGAGVLAWVLWRTPWRDTVGPDGAPEPGLLSALAGADPWWLLFAVALYGFATVAGVVRFAALLRAQGAALSYALVAQLTYVGLFFNLALPGSNGGDLVKVGWVARATGRLAPAIAATALDRVVGLFCLTLVAIGPAVCALGDPAYVPVGIVTGSVFLGALGFAGLYLCPPVRRLASRTHNSARPLVRALGSLDAALVAYRRTPRAVAAACAMSIIGQAGVIGACWAVAEAMGISGVNWLMVAPAIMIVSAIPLAPGGVGQTEAAFANFLVGLGVAVAPAVAVGLAYRLLVVAYGCAGGVVLALARSRPVDTPPVPPDSAAP